MPSSNPFDEDYDPNLTVPPVSAEPAQVSPPAPAPASNPTPFDEGYVPPDPEPAPPSGPLITAPGAYPDIDARDYHRNPNLLPGPSLSSSGAKTILNKSPFHFWFDSPLNPNRPEESDKPHFAVGRAAHDLILLPDRWAEEYHVTPEGFAWNKTKQMSYEIGEAEEALKAGKTILSFEQDATVRRVAAAIQRSPLAIACLTNGVTEETLVWKDRETGVWLRARPDFRPHSIVQRLPVRVVADLKFVAESHLSPRGFSRAIGNFGYHMSAAFYWEGIKEVFDIEPTHWVHVVIEKDLPHCLALYELPAEDIERGRALNRRAIRKFADCLSADRWPGYADEPVPVGLPIYARMDIDNTDPDEAEFAAA